MKFTVAVINYNYARYLKEAVESALSQGAEVIVVDDCSTDDSLAVVAEFGDTVRLITHQENSGTLVRSWNEAIEAANGEYVIFLSSDDALAPKALERIEECAVTRGGDWIFGDLSVVDDEGTVIEEYIYSAWPTEPLTALARGFRVPSIPVTMFAAFRVAWLRENRCEAVEFDGCRQAADTSTCITWLAKWPRIRRIPEVLFRYRKHAGQETEELDENREQMQAAMLALYERLFDHQTLNVVSSLL